MSKLITTCIPVFLLIGAVLSYMPQVAAQTITMTVTPKSVGMGDVVNVKISELPKEDGAYSLTVKRSTATITGGEKIGNLQIVTQAAGNCQFRLASEVFTSRSTPSCTGTGPFIFATDIDTLQVLADPNSKLDLTYSVILGGTTAGDNLAEDSFTIAAPKKDLSGFRIDKIVPNPTQPDTDVNVNLSGTKAGTYGSSLAGNNPQLGQCAASTCSLKLHIPKDISSPTVDVIVVDPDGKMVTSRLLVTLPNPINNTLNLIKSASQKATVVWQPCDYSFGVGGFKFFSVDDQPGLHTAIGCIPTKPDHLVGALLIFAIGIGGGIAFLIMLLAAGQMIISAGNPQTLKSAQELFSNAIIGLLFILFSALLLQFIGAGILKLPGFS